MKAGLLTLLLVAATAGPALAQAPGEPVAADAAAPSASASEPAVDTAKLGISMSRIQRGLRVSQAREQSSADGLKLEYQIQVFGKAPRIDIIQDFDIGPQAPLQYGAPTHNEFVNLWTPQAYRSPGIPFSSVAAWAVGALAKRADKSKCEQELADYRAAVMQGIAIAAPRCTQ